MTSEGVSHDSLKARLKQAGQRVRDDLALVGGRAGYAWPSTPGRIWGGYSYEIPKEEQIRSAFWAQLHDREALACELEWNHYALNGRIVTKGEIDLAGFDLRGRPGAPVLLLEFKRVWNLRGWLNKSREMVEGIEVDRRKLERARSALGTPAGTALLAGVVVVAFSDRPEELGDTPTRNLWPGWPNGWEEIWDVGEPLCHAELESGPPRPIYSRADLLIVS